MKDAYEVLYQKEADLARLRQEVESLRITAPLLSDEDGASQATELHPKKPSEPAFESQSDNAATGTDSPFPNPRPPSFWEFLKPARR